MTDVTSRLTAALADRYRIERELGAALGGERFFTEIRTTALASADRKTLGAAQDALLRRPRL